MKLSCSIILRDLLGKKRSFVDKLTTIDIFAQDSISTVFATFKKSGIDGIELLLPKEYTQNDLSEAKKLLQQCNMPVLSIHQPLRFLSTTYLSEVEKLFEVADFFNAKVITLHLNAAGKEVFSKRYITRIKELEEKYKIYVGYENSQKHILSFHKKFVWHEDVFFDFVKQMGFHIVFDTTHFGTTGTNIVSVFKRNKENIINIHIGDYKTHAFSSSLRPLAYTHLPLGRGNLPMKEFLKALKNEKYNGLITMEIDHVDYNELCRNAELIKSSLE